MTRKNSSRKSSTAASQNAEPLGRELSDAVIFFHEAVASHLGISAAEWKCLGLLDRHGPLTAGRVAELSGFTTGAITGIADRLEQAGYVRRKPHPADRRSVILQPLRVKDVQERIAPIFRSLGSAMAVIASHYSASKLAAIAEFFRETAEALRSETAKLRNTKPRWTRGRR